MDANIRLLVVDPHPEFGRIVIVGQTLRLDLVESCSLPEVVVHLAVTWEEKDILTRVGPDEIGHDSSIRDGLMLSPNVYYNIKILKIKKHPAPAWHGVLYGGSG